MEDNNKRLSTEETEVNIGTENQLDTLDALLLDDEGISGETNSVDDIEFETFMAEYRDLISKNLAEAAERKAQGESVGSEAEKKAEPLSSSKKQKQKQSPKAKGAKASPNTAEENDWDEKITLAPEEYVDLVDENNPLLEEITEDNAQPDFDLGETDVEKTDDFQISINFDGEERHTSTQEENDEEITKKYDPENPRLIDWVFDVAEIFAFVLAVVMLLTTFVFRHSIVEGGSMQNTLQEGEHLIISNLFYEPDYGDIIVFEDYSSGYAKKAVVKRVIALPGDTVEVRCNEYGDVIVYVNGNLVEEDYALNTRDADIDMSNFNKPITIGEDEVYVLGDNRYHSLDSRSSIIGPIKKDAILGKVLFRFLPFDKFGAVE